MIPANKHTGQRLSQSTYLSKLECLSRDQTFAFCEVNCWTKLLISAMYLAQLGGMVFDTNFLSATHLAFNSKRAIKSCVQKISVKYC